MVTQDKKALLKYAELKQRLQQIDDNQHRAFLKTVYGCCARVGEIVRGNYSENPPISLQDLEVTSDLLIFNVLTEKTNKMRRVPISRKDDSSQQYFKKSESWLTEDILEFCVSQEKPLLFDYSTRWGQEVFKKYFPEFKWHIHLLRHWRASHLLQGSVTGVRVPMHVVAKIGGWKGTKTLSDTYDNTIIEDYITIKEDEEGL